jgi:hypothetical protein
MRQAGFVATLLVALCGLAPAQQGVTAAKEPTGAVTGRVICGDTNLPARIASVTLIPVVDSSPPPSHTGGSSQRQSRETPTTIAETLLDGTFTIPDVKPGNYYVAVEELGYLSPFAQLSREDLDHPTQETAALMARLLTPVSVAPNRTTSTEVRILKGATISGTIRFDDGSPDAGAGVMLFRKDKLGKWTGFRTNLAGRPSNSGTDDQGHYRLSGLPAGEYLVATDLQLSDIIVGGIFSKNGFSSSSNTRYSLNIYYPDSTRQRDAKPIKLDEGQEASAIDIEIPLTKLHSVTGSVVEAGTGQTVNAATLTLLYPDDNSRLVSTQIRKGDDAFHFYFVPEGSYTIKVTNARAVTREEIANPQGSWLPTHTVEKKLRDYGGMEQPITLQTDMTGVILAVPDKPADSKAAP